jgi:2-oxoglutarate dehydrogenase E1 component
VKAKKITSTTIIAVMLSKALRASVFQATRSSSSLPIRYGRSPALGLIRSQNMPSCVKKYSSQAPTVESSPPAPVPLKKLAASWLNGESSYYIEELYDRWKENPNNVDPSWNEFFTKISAGISPEEAYPIPDSTKYSLQLARMAAMNVSLPTTDAALVSPKIIEESLKVMLLVRSYQIRGHAMANLDPLGLAKPVVYPELTLANYGWNDSDLDREVFLPLHPDITSGFIVDGRTKKTLRQILDKLKLIYCGTIGIEYMHIQSRQQRNWLRERIESDSRFNMSKEDRLNTLDRLAWATQFERFLALKWSRHKRFGLDGCEVLIPGMKTLIDRSAELGVESIVMGMAHRGRLNVLGNVVRKPFEHLFYEFEKGAVIPEDWGTGDVKYHLGTSYDRPTRSGKKVHLSLVANPSHLEAVNPVVEGKTRAKQFYLNDDETHEKVMAIQIHGDASFAGQGVVFETLNFSGVPWYSTGGTIHIIINNQIGFTTEPKDARGGTYCTDVAKALQCPILHVNGDDPEAVIFCCNLAAEWRKTFKKDFVIDIVCYRRHGHNEGDQPAFTQPIMYQRIAKQQPTLELYANKLIAAGIITEEEFVKMKELPWETLKECYERSKTYIPQVNHWLESRWEGFRGPKQLARIKNTGVPMEQLRIVAECLTTIPPNFTLHPNLARIMEEKKKTLETGKGIEWGTAEALAFGTLLLEGNHVRISGQDVQRGTFAHRHAVLHDYNTGAEYIPLQHLPGAKSKFHVINSPLSEFGVLGFELGYSLESPNALVIWEAQYGDFANGAQVIIDQFISTGEKKWFRQSGITLLLPHGYEGGGPEHSSARLERFLTLSDSDPDSLAFDAESQKQALQMSNWQVCNVTTAANYFHLLRRQIHREYRKPLVVMTPKSGLRHRLSKSDLTSFDDSGDDVRFERVFDEIEPKVIPEKCRRLIFCTGKIWLDLFEARCANESDQRSKYPNVNCNDYTVALVRVEQLVPFPADKILEVAKRYPNAEIVWCQEGDCFKFEFF